MSFSEPSNLLISTDARLTIADFGLARCFGIDNEQVTFTHQVVTRWYRAPELLFGARRYSGGIDGWACACIFAEMLLRGPLFAGETDVDQLNKITQAMGTIDDTVWPNVSVRSSERETIATGLNLTFGGRHRRFLTLFASMVARRHL